MTGMKNTGVDIVGWPSLFNIELLIVDRQKRGKYRAPLYLYTDVYRRDQLNIDIERLYSTGLSAWWLTQFLVDIFCLLNNRLF